MVTWTVVNAMGSTLERGRNGSKLETQRATVKKWHGLKQCHGGSPQEHGGMGPNSTWTATVLVTGRCTQESWWKEEPPNIGGMKAHPREVAKLKKAHRKVAKLRKAHKKVANREKSTKRWQN